MNDGLVLNGKELELKDGVGKTKPGIRDTVENKLNKNIKSHDFSQRNI